MRVRIIAAVELALIFPAVLFMAALVVRNLRSPYGAAAAQQLVFWYAGRMWTLWLLLLALPLAALVCGCATLLQIRKRANGRTGGTGHSAVVVWGPALLCLCALTVAAGAILAIVVLHMAAN